MGIFLASLKHLEKLKKIEIPFNYRNHIELELKSEKKFRWVVSEENGRIVGFHRSIINNGWGYFAGLYVNNRNGDLSTVQRLITYAIEDLKKRNCIGLIAWDQYPNGKKTLILSRMGFNLDSNIYYRFFFGENSIVKLLSDYSQSKKWRFSKPSDYTEILEILKKHGSYVDRLPEFFFESGNWVVFEENQRILAAINWWVHNDTLEVLFTLSSERDKDIFEGLQFLLFHSIQQNQLIKIFKVNLEEQRKISLIRIFSYQPGFYKEGFENSCLLKKFTD